ncbi:MAG: S49 family peptidase [Leptospiraceae bacterium]|nr:S49 family peptidase [Leptospiraceae bacterium]MCP5512043.1 S49 family peptidase [Leptospiraceae bacterium]
MRKILTLLAIPFRLFPYIFYKLLTYKRNPEFLFFKIPSVFENSKKSPLLELFSGGNQQDFLSFLQFLNKLLEIKSLRIVAFTVDEIQFGFSELYEISEILNKLKENGVRLKGFSPYGDLKTLYLLSQADERFCIESSEFQFVLPSAEPFFFGKFLKDWGIEVESYQSGKFKSFAEPFKNEKFSKEARQNLSELIVSLRNRILSGMHGSEKWKWEDIHSPILHADEMKEGGFFHDFSDESEFEKYFMYDKLEEKSGQFKKSKIYKLATISKYLKRTKYSLLPVRKSRITILPLKGNIVMGKKSEQERNEGSISAYSTLNLLAELKKEDDRKIIILEIDSGGGSAFASELIYRELKNIGKDKKIYAYFQNISASGGYYISCAAGKIFSNPFCITGSIGTIMIRPNLRGLYEKFGIKKERIEFYPLRDILSEYGKISPQSKAFLQSEIERNKMQFYKRVMDNRKIDIQDLEKSAGGRVFLAEKFEEMGMLDGTGSFYTFLNSILKENDIDSYRIDYLMPVYTLRSMLKNWNSVLGYLKNPSSFFNESLSFLNTDYRVNLPVDLITYWRGRSN